MYETKEEKIELVKSTIKEIATRASLSVEVEVEDSVGLGLIFNIASPDSHFSIGRQGSHLHAFQVLVQAFVAKQLRGSSSEPFYYTIDVDDYKRKREWYLKQTAQKAVEQVKRTGRPISLEPMPNYDRRLIHVYLQENYPDIISESIGYEPNRKLVIKEK